jgi:hypothetical protein
MDVKGMVEDVFQRNDESLTVEEMVVGLLGELLGWLMVWKRKPMGAMIMLLILVKIQWRLELKMK